MRREDSIGTPALKNKPAGDGACVYVHAVDRHSRKQNVGRNGRKVIGGKEWHMKAYKGVIRTQGSRGMREVEPKVSCVHVYLHI